MSDLSPNLALPLLLPAQAQKHVTHNEALALLDLLVQLRVQRFDARTPPEAPGDGEVHAVGAGATGAWAGQDGRLAAWMGGGWVFVAPREGWRAWDVAGAEVRVHADGAWRPLEALPPGTVERLGVNATSDAGNRLAVAAPATLLTHEGAGHQLKIDKAATGDTASLLFQTGFSGRAEMGTAGSDDWSIKVSADGGSWNDAIVVDKDSGHIAVGPGEPPLGIAALVTNGGVQMRLDYGATAVRGLRLEKDNGPGQSYLDWGFNTNTNDWVFGQFSVNGASNVPFRLGISSPGAPDIEIVPDVRVSFDLPARLPSYTTSTLPSASGAGAGSMVFVTDEAGGAVPAFSDGTDWRRVTDRAVVS